MRFRLANSVGANQGGQQLASGIGSLFQGFAMAPVVQAQEAEARIAAETKAANDAERLRAESALRAAQEGQARASALASQGHAALYGKQADAITEQQNRGTLGELIKSAAMTRGIPQAMAPDLDYAINTGGLPQGKYQSPNAQAEFANFLRTGAPTPGAAVDTSMGPSMPLPDALRPENIAKVMRDIGLMQNSLTLGKGTVEDMAKAQDIYRSQDLGDEVLAGSRTAGQVGQAQAAMKGTKLIDNIGDSGAGFNMFTGEGQTLNPGMVALFGNRANAQIGADNARAGASKASAASSWASARKTNQDRAMGAKGVLRDTEQGLALINPQTGAVSFVNGPDGRPLTKAAAPAKALPTSAANGLLTNVQNMKRAETALALINGENVGTSVGDPNATGWKGLLPNSLLNRWDEKGVDTRAQIADLGSLVIHDRSGAAVTAAEFPRLAPFIPTAYDDPATAKKKLERFVQVYRETVDDQATFYKESGYNVPDVSSARTAPVATPRPSKPAAALPPRNAKGWALQEDAKGNRAYVSPDGRQFEEVR